MKVLSVATACLLAGTTVAVPSEPQVDKLEKWQKDRRAKRVAEMQMRRTGPPLAENFTSLDDRVSVGPGTEAQYDSNWAGSIMLTSDITEVYGEFNVPTAKTPPGGNSNTAYGAAIWVGIDGDTCTTAILQTGVEMAVEGAEHEYFGWYEWYPNYSHKFADFKVSPGDKVKASVKATSDTSGTATLENVSTGKSVTKTFTNMGSVGSLCRKNAEWIVEDFESGNKLVPFADFGKVTFTGAGYNTGSGSHGVGGAGVVDIKQNVKVDTKCSSGGSTVTCTYVG